MGRWSTSAAGVRNLLPHRPITDGTVPSLEQVEGYVEVVGDLVAARVGELDPAQVAVDATRGRFVGLARAAVHAGAASYTEAAANPDLADPADTSSTAAYWWARHEQLLEALAVLVDAYDPGPDPAGAGLVSEGPAHSFPEPIGWDERLGRP